MTVATDVAELDLATDGVSKVFALTGPNGGMALMSAADLQVWFVGADGADTALTYTVDYSISGDLRNGAASLTTLGATAYADGGLLAIRRNTARTQPEAWADNDGFAAATMQNAQDRGRLIDQDEAARGVRALSGPEWEGAIAAVPGKAARLGKVLSFDAVTGDPTVSDPMVVDAQQAAADAMKSAAAAGADLWSRPVDAIAAVEPDAPDIGDRLLLDETNATHANQVAEYFVDGWHYSGAPRVLQQLFVGTSKAALLFDGAVFGYKGAPALVNSPYYAEMESGVVGDNSAHDDTVGINAAIVYAADQKRILKCNRKFYCNAGDTGVKWQSGAMVEGSGYETGFCAIDNCAAGDLMAYYDPANTVEVSMFNLGLDGRQRLDDAAGVANANMPNIVNGLNNSGALGPAQYGPRHRFDTIRIKNFTGRGQTIGFAQRSSFFTNFVIYYCNSYGLVDASNDCYVGNYDIGQCWADANAAANPAGWFVTNILGGQRGNFKVWGTGQYGGVLAVPGIFLRNVANINFSNIWTQESGGPGLSVFGSGQTVPAVIFTNFAGDGDCIAAAATAEITLNNTEGFQLVGRAGKWENGLAGNPTNAIDITASVVGSQINLQTKGLTGSPVKINSAAVGNDISINGHRNKTLNHAYGANFTAEVFDARNHTVTLTGTTLVNAPTIVPDGELLSFAFLNDAGAAAPTWNAAFLPPPDWAANFVTTEAKRNVVTFRRSAVAGKWICQSAIYGV